MNTGSLFVLMLVASGGLSLVNGQEKHGIQLTRETILADRHEIVQRAMSFTPAELEAFKPVYREWRNMIEAIGNRKIELIGQLMEGSDTLTDADAKSLTDEWIKIQEDELKLKKTYVAKMRAILPQKKVARFFQLENKLDAALLYNLAGSVPLVDQ